MANYRFPIHVRAVRAEKIEKIAKIAKNAENMNNPNFYEIDAVRLQGSEPSVVSLWRELSFTEIYFLGSALFQTLIFQMIETIIAVYFCLYIVKALNSNILFASTQMIVLAVFLIP